MMKKCVLSFLCIALVLSAFMGMPVSADTLSDGIYNVKVKTSYADPDTGKPVDGGTNIALGDGMCKSIVESSMLIEQAKGKTYVTIGLGLMSQIENVRIQVQGTDGKYHDVAIEKTGSCHRQPDICHHYRFEVVSAEKYISPRLFVKPMGRDVQFFILPDMKTAKPGKGDFGKASTTNTETSDKDKTPDKTNPTPNKPTPDKDKKPANNHIAGETHTPNSDKKEPAKDSPSVSGGTTLSAEGSQNITNAQDSSQPSTAVTSPAADTSSDKQQESLQANTSHAEKSTHIVWWIVGAAVIVLAGGAVWYFCFQKKRK